MATFTAQQVAEESGVHINTLQGYCRTLGFEQSSLTKGQIRLIKETIASKVHGSAARREQAVAKLEAFLKQHKTGAKRHKPIHKANGVPVEAANSGTPILPAPQVTIAGYISQLTSRVERLEQAVRELSDLLMKQAEYTNHDNNLSKAIIAHLLQEVSK